MTHNSKKNQRLSAVRKMAAKKGAQIPFQIDVTTEDEWEKMLEKKGLVVVDVYSEWCGPCVAMVSTLKKLKLEIGSDYLHFVTAKSDTVECLKRFRNKSEPTWMIIASGHLVNLMFGVDAPQLLNLIKREFECEMNVLDDKQERNWIAFDELTEEERKRAATVAIKEEERKQDEQKMLIDKLKVIRQRSLEKLSKMIPHYSCILYLPHMVTLDGGCPIAIKMMYMYDSISVMVADQMLIKLNDHLADHVFYNCSIYDSLDMKQKKSLLDKHVLVTLLQIINMEDDSDPLSPRKFKVKNELGSIEKVLCKIVYGMENPSCYTEYSAAYEFIIEDENGEKLFPMWTPNNPISKAAAIEILFPRRVEDVGYVPEQLPPPQLIIIYDAVKAGEIIDLLKQFKTYVLNIGYFDSADAQVAKLVCKKYYDLQKLPDDQIKNTKLVVALKKEESDEVLLEMSQFVPLYISADEKMGANESEVFFPYGYINEEGEEIESASEDKNSDYGEQSELFRSDDILEIN